MFRSLERRCLEKDRVLVGVLLEEARNQRATRLWSSQGVLLEILVGSLYVLISFKLIFISYQTYKNERTRSWLSVPSEQLYEVGKT